MFKKFKTISISLLLLGFLLMPSLSLADEYVNGYYRSNGTYVNGYYRSSPDGDPYNNYSFPGNYNPYTEKTATGNADTYLNNYYSRSFSYGDRYTPSYYDSSYDYMPSYDTYSSYDYNYSSPTYDYNNYYTPSYSTPDDNFYSPSYDNSSYSSNSYDWSY